MPTIKFLILCISLVLVQPTIAQYGSCDYAQTLVVGRSYDVFSPNYGSNKPYSPGETCRWVATSPAGTKITVSCADIRLPYSPVCTDRIEISYSGNPLLTDARRYCSNQPFTNQTQSNKIAIALKSTLNGSGGYFLCKLIARAPASVPVQQQPINTHNGQCGRRKVSRIVGGSATLINEFPMMAGLVEGYKPLVFCGAVIVSPYSAVTSVECFNRKIVTDIQLLVGAHDYRTGGYDTKRSYSSLYPLRSALFHPAYSAQTNLNDIAIVTTVNMIQYNVAVGPVCLPYGNDQLVGQTVEAVGWGTTSFLAKPSEVLQKVTVRVISYQQCYDYYGSKIAYSQLCTLAPSRDACKMDTGGPMFLTSGGLVYLAGVISYGTGCAEGKPGVSTRATYYADWIRANMH